MADHSLPPQIAGTAEALIVAEDRLAQLEMLQELEGVKVPRRVLRYKVILETYEQAYVPPRRATIARDR